MADIKLLNTDQRMGSSYHEIFNKQYEGLTKFNQEVNSDINNSKLDNVKKDLKSSSKAIDNLATNMTFNGIKMLKDHYAENGPLNEGVINTAYNDLNLMGTELEAIRAKKVTNKRDKDRQTKLTRNMSMWRKNLVEMKPLITSTVKGIVEGHYNEELSFAKNPEVGAAFKQWLDPKSKYEELGIGTYFNEVGEMHMVYTPGNVFKSEYENNSRAINFDPRLKDKEARLKRQIEEQQGLSVSFDEFLSEARGEQFGEAPIGNSKVVPIKEILGGFVKKDIKTNNKINDVFGDILKTSEKRIPSEDNKSKIYLYEKFEDLEAITYDSYKDLFLTADAETGDFANIQDLSTRDILIAGKMRNYKQDLLEEKSFFHKLRYEDVGLNNTLDTNDDGFISNNELDEDSKDELAEILTNPQTPSERQTAAEQLAWYLTQITKQAVESQRGRQASANQTSGLAMSVEAATAGLTQPTQEATEEGTSELAKQLIEKYSK